MAYIPAPSQNFDERANGQSPSMIIIHYTGTPTADEALSRFRDPAPTDAIGRISPHYMIGANAEIYALVDETKRAWHAGRAAWGDCTDINSASIGIEIWNSGHEYDFEDFMPAQIDALINLIRDISTRWQMPDRNILGHSDVAPGRMLDPGEKFPWGKLAAGGIGLMPVYSPSPQPSPARGEGVFWGMIREYGYTYAEDKTILLTEFRRHFLPHLVQIAGQPTDEDACALASLLEQAKI